MQNNSSNETRKPAGRVIKYLLSAFVALSIGTAIYKMLPCCSGEKDTLQSAETGQTDNVSIPKAEAKATAAPDKNPAVKSTEARKVEVYYFYTDVRCSSCKTIEAYTREAVETKLAGGYKGWKIEFKGINVDLPENKHFIQDYWLNSKSVVAQKFSGEKPLNWALLKDVWQLIGNKEAFMNYVAGETKKLIDSK